jgi:putative component of toxin-antitoxin plasmid stabilization module
VTDVSILHYRTVEGRFPYREWVESIADKAARAAVFARVDRLAFGRVSGSPSSFATLSFASPI